MNANERTRDIYEEMPGHVKPPLVPLPEAGDLSSLERLGLKPGRASRWIVEAAMGVTGFRGFYARLPYTIEGLLRRCELRGAYLFAPVISATLALEDDPRGVTPIQRAATLLFAARSLYEDVTSGNLAPDRHRGQVLEMGQYRNLFSTNLIVDGKWPRIFKSANVCQIAIAVSRRFYVLEVGDPGSETTIERLEEALAEIVHTAQRNRLTADEPAPGILTCATHETQLRIFRRLKKSRANAESLFALRHSFLTLCLDLDSHPSSYAEAALMAHSGNCGNRWYHASLQLVVFGNARACAICSFSTYLDGNTMTRAASELQKRATRCPIGSGAGRGFRLLPAIELRWKIDRGSIARAQRELRAVQDNQQATFEIRGIGRDFFAAHQVEAVPAFTLALQMTARRLTGQMAGIMQFLTMSRYCCMSLTTAMVTTPEVTRFVESVEDSDVQGGQAIALLQDAIRSQARECRTARRYLPLDEVIGLFVLSRQGARQWYVSAVIAVALVLLCTLGLFKPTPRQVLVSHPEIYPQVPVVGRPGIRLPYVEYFGLHYQILDEHIVVTVMPSVSWTIPNAELVAELEKNLKHIQQTILGERCGPA